MPGRMRRPQNQATAVEPEAVTTTPASEAVRCRSAAPTYERAEWRHA